MRPYQLTALALFVGLFSAGCDEESTASTVPLVEDLDATITTQVVQNLNPDLEVPASGEVTIYNLTGEVQVATAAASPLVVPIAWGDPSADPQSDFMMVTVQIVDAYVDDIKQVELNIAIGQNGSSDAQSSWCEPMDPDSLVTGLYSLRLQPSCNEADRDPLTGECVITGTCDGYPEGCREDVLTFSLWSDVTADCHTRESAD